MAAPTLRAVLHAPAPDEAWFEGLLRYLAAASPGDGRQPQRTERLVALGHYLKESPEGELWRARIRSVWTHTSAVRLLADTGMPVHTSFGREAFERVVERFIPSLDPEADLSALLNRLGLDPEDADWIEGLSEGEAGLWRDLLALPPEAVWDALELVAFRAAALGLARDMLMLFPGDRELDSPFMRLPEAASRLRAGGEPRWTELLALCRQRLQDALGYLDAHGISSELVYRLELLETQVRRMEELADLALGRLDGKAFAAALVRQTAEHRRLTALLRGTLHRLARRVVEHTGQTGEHYIANTRSEWLRTFASAAGGGALTAFTAGFKYGIAAMPLAPMVSGLAFALNYTGSFLAMQFAGFTLASKQPSMTAATLAAAMELQPEGELVVERVAGIARSQFMATLGNVLVAIPSSLLLGIAWSALTGRPALSAATAAHSLHSLHPLHSWTLPFAALTGVFLWLSSLAAGWASNWSAFRRLPEALARHRRLLAWFGPRGAAWAGNLVERHLSGMVGYLVLGFLLGFVPVACAFMGIPLEVRHVTLSAASLGLCAAQAFQAGVWPWRDLLWALLGIAGIGLFNFGVSFDLALRTARRARGLEAGGLGGGLGRLRGEISAAFRRNPWRFLGPPRPGQEA